MSKSREERCPWARNPLSIQYHDEEWGVPCHDDRRLFEFLILEGAQAGLSWDTILAKRERYREVFDGFDPVRVASYGPRKLTSLLADPGIIRNRLKVGAAIHNAQVIRGLRDSHGGFAEWLDANHPLDLDGWKRLFKKTFRFTGGEIVNEFLMSLGYLPGAHQEDCPVMHRIRKAAPPCLQVSR